MLSKSKIIFNAMVLGLILFSFLALATSTQSFEQYAPFVPVVIAAFAATRMHHLNSKEFLQGSLVGGVTGLLLGLIGSLVLVTMTIIYALGANNLLNQLDLADNVPVILIVIPIAVTVVSTIVGSFVGFATVIMNRLF
jgi:hypothetical protein